MLGFFEEKYYFVGELAEFERYCRTCNHEFSVSQEIIELLNEGRLIALFAKIGEKISARTKNGNIFKIHPALEAMNSDVQRRYDNRELSELCDLSKDYFLKTFKKVMNVTPQQYYTSLVIDKGRYLLANTAYSISEISRLCGIEDSFYFSRLFKKHTGISPREYRNS